jgi:hypothetical protein
LPLRTDRAAIEWPLLRVQRLLALEKVKSSAADTAAAPHLPQGRAKSLVLA